MGRGLLSAWGDRHGRTPRPADVHASLAYRSPDKRGRWIDRLLAEPPFAVHFANLWRAELLPEAASNPQAALLRPGFENWLARQIRAGTIFGIAPAARPSRTCRPLTSSSGLVQGTASAASTINGVLYNGNNTRINEANTVYSALNEAGDIN